MEQAHGRSSFKSYQSGPLQRSNGMREVITGMGDFLGKISASDCLSG